MFVKLPKGLQRSLFSQAIKKAGSERKLALILDMPHSTIYEYKNERTNLPSLRFNRLIDFLGKKVSDFHITYLPTNWGRVKGGINCVKQKRKNGTLDKNLQYARKNSKGIGEWHKQMKKTDPENYHIIQYEHFKKVGSYKFRTLNGESVRNKLEKEVADFLYNHNFGYSYEKIVNCSEKYYFPDFRIGSIIIECTAWKGYTKAYQLRDKIADLESAGFTVLVFVPKSLQHFYKVIDSYLITNFSELRAKLSLGSSVSP